MTSQIIPVDPFDFIIFGGTGDLAERKLLPALFHRQQAGQFSEPTRIIGASRARMSDEEYRAFAHGALIEHVKAEEIDPAELERFVGAAVLRVGRRQVGRGLRRPQDGAGRQRADPHLLPGGGALAVRRHRREGGHARPGDSQCADRRREADRPRPGVGESAERPDRHGLRRAADLPHRPLSRQGDGAEPDGAALRQRALRAAVELRPHRPRADHGGRDRRPGRPRRLLRQGRRAARHGAEPHPAAALPGRHGGAVLDGRQTRCATRSSRCCAR